VSSRGVVKKPLSPQLGPAVRLLRMTGSGRWYSTRLERPLSGSCAAKRRAACNGIFAGATDRAASAKVRFVPHTDVLADKMLRHARMAAMRKLHRSVVGAAKVRLGPFPAHWLEDFTFLTMSLKKMPWRNWKGLES